MSIYLKAAKKLVESEIGDYDFIFACNSIRNSGGTDIDVERMESYFKPDRIFGAWYAKFTDGCRDDEFHPDADLGNLGRSLMLLFMHEISK